MGVTHVWIDSLLTKRPTRAKFKLLLAAGEGSKSSYCSQWRMRHVSKNRHQEAWVSRILIVIYSVRPRDTENNLDNVLLTEFWWVIRQWQHRLQKVESCIRVHERSRKNNSATSSLSKSSSLLSTSQIWYLKWNPHLFNGDQTYSSLIPKLWHATSTFVITCLTGETTGNSNLSYPARIESGDVAISVSSVISGYSMDPMDTVCGRSWGTRQR